MDSPFKGLTLSLFAHLKIFSKFHCEGLPILINKLDIVAALFTRETGRIGNVDADLLIHFGKSVF